MAKIVGGTVKISIKRQDEKVVFTIKDDGVGMDEIKSKELLTVTTKERGIGIWNINQRLKMMYNTELKVISEKGNGTQVSFELPVNNKKLR